MSSWRSEYEAVDEEFKQAEKDLKFVEGLTEQLAIPAINELRYAGRHLLTAGLLRENGGDETEARQNLQSALNHCKRAVFDSADAGLNFIISEANAFKKDYRKVQIAAVLPDYIDILTRLDEANTLIQKFAEHDERAQHYVEARRFLREGADDRS